MTDILAVRKSKQADVSGAVARITAVMASFVFVVAVFAVNPAAARGAPDSFADLAERLLPSVVNIQTTQRASQQAEAPRFQLPPGSPLEEFFERFNRPEEDRPQRRATSLGSGFIVDANGYIVTNRHVINGADEIFVVLHDDERFKAELVGDDEKTDLALLKIDTDRSLTAVGWGRSEKSRVGDWVVAIGNPLGLGGTVTAGIISARGRDIRSGPYDDYIQTDAPINRGNSGGPLFNLDGEVIGVNTAIYSPNGGSIGIGFAIPSRLASGVIGQLREFGTTRRGWLGVTIQQVTDDIAESLGLSDAIGALVATVHKDSPAAAAGVRTGDVILMFNGKTVPSSRKLPAMVAETGVGQIVAVQVWRGGETIDVDVTLGELEKVDLASLTTGRPPAESTKTETADLSDLGLTVAGITDELVQQFKLKEDAKGVVVTAVSEASDAAEKQLRPGGIIVEVNQAEVATPEAVLQRVEEAREDGRKSVLLLVDQGGELRFVAIRFAKKEG